MPCTTIINILRAEWKKMIRCLPGRFLANKPPVGAGLATRLAVGYRDSGKTCFYLAVNFFRKLLKDYEAISIQPSVPD
ncbi:hypothetical protein C7B82_12935 [Stenomitos frigidus ULC18]|uniref:Uncharacterized protein n=1 Tax=Stenomitos frigidus ULC18 TaxID=2107698 RepID=A0A2T1E7A7_9CYAN|nr:hypothetical protein C7B82_12935 [Stenomitos frigidus ULC18]